MSTAAIDEVVYLDHNAGWAVTRVPVTPAGLLELAADTAALSGDVALCTVLLAMGVAPEVARSAVRLSLGRDTTGAAVALAADRLVAAWRQAREEHPVPETSKRERAFP